MAQLKDLIVTGPSRFLNDLYALTIYEGGVKLEDKYYLATNPSGYTSNAGTVTSVSASGSGGISISGSPVTTSGTISISLNLSTAINGLPIGTSNANRNDYAVVQSAGGGTSDTSYYRRPISKIFAALISDDIPNLAASKITSGTFDTARIPNLSYTKITGISGTSPISYSGGAISLSYDSTTLDVASNALTVKNPLPFDGDSEYDILMWDGTNEAPIWTASQSVQSNPFYVAGSGSTAAVTSGSSKYAARWRGTNYHVATLTTGTLIYYKLDVAGNGDYGTVLALNGGAEHPVIVNASNYISSRYPVGSIIPLIYDADQSSTAYINNVSTTITGCWKIWEYDTTNVYNLMAQYTQPKVDANSDFSVYRRQFILTTKTGTVVPYSNGNNNVSGTTFTMTTDPFDPFAPIYYFNYAGSTVYNAGATLPAGYLYTCVNAFDARYAFDIINGSTAGTKSLTATKPVYIKALYDQSTHTAILQPDNSDVNNYIAKSSLVQDLPTTNPGANIIYIFMGYAYTSYQINLHNNHPVYRWDSNTNSMAIFSDSVYTSKSAASGGTDVSLVTTGEKYTWNNKKGLPSYSSSDRGKFLVVSEGDGSPAWETLYWSDISNKPEVTEVKLNAKTDSSNYRVLLGPSSPTDGSTSEAYYANTEHKRLSFNPSNGDLLGIGLINGNPLGSLFSVSPDGDGGYLLYDPGDPDYQYQWVTPPNNKVSMTANTGSTALSVLLGPSSITSGNAYGANYANTSGKQLKFTPSTGNLSGVAQINGSAVTSSPKFTDTLADYISTWYSGQNTGFVKYAYNGAPDLYVESGVGYDDLSHTWNAWPNRSDAMLTIYNRTTQQSNDWLTGWNFHAPNMAENTDMGYANFAAINLGKNGEARNSGSIVFHYAGNNALKNCITFGLSYNDHILQMRAGVSNDNLRTVHVRGNIYAQADLTPNGIGKMVATQDWVNTHFVPTCLIKGTKILMADGTEKNIEDVKRGDEVKSIDINSGKIITAMVVSCEKTGVDHEYTTHLFDNGSYIVTYGLHSVYNKTLGHPIDISKFRIGDETYDAEGKVITYAGNMRYYDRSTDVAHYDINTSNNLYFANGILNGKNVFAKYRYMRREEMNIPTPIQAVLDRQETANKPTIGYETDPNYFRAIAAKLKEKSVIAKRIEEAKQKLADSDYLVAKFTEGLISAVDWLKAKAERSNWRTAINNDEPLLEAADNAIKAIKAKYQTDDSSVKDRFELFSAWDNAALEYYREWLVEKESDNEPIENIEPREGYWANGLNN